MLISIERVPDLALMLQDVARAVYTDKEDLMGLRALVDVVAKENIALCHAH